MDSQRDTGHTAFVRLCDLERTRRRSGRSTSANSRKSRSEIKGLALWVDGKVSERATQELKNRKIDLATGVLDGK